MKNMKSKDNFWSFIRYSKRVIKEYKDLEYFLDYYIEDKIREKFKCKNEDPTPEYDLLNFEVTDDGVMILDIDVYDLPKTITMTISNNDITKEMFENLYYV